MELKTYITLFFLMVSSSYPLQAQRLLAGQKAVELSVGVPIHNDKNWKEAPSFQLAVTSNTAYGNYWKFGVEYQRKAFDYKQWQLPYEQYNGNIGYFLQLLSNRRKSLLLYGGVSAVAGYEVFNSNTEILNDGAALKNQSGFVYGGIGTLSLESYLSDRWVLFAFSDMTYLPKSSLQSFSSGWGVGLRIFF